MVRRPTRAEKPRRVQCMSDGVRIVHASRSVHAIVASIGSRDRRIDPFARACTRSSSRPPR
ncbi:MAG: hypothetical protein DMF85_04015 [Acidobacteria bacterium]|nr:MAG: hypothetical protein DMF85_04015 [Acidobacteriota bacterium]